MISGHLDDVFDQLREELFLLVGAGLAEGVGFVGGARRFEMSESLAGFFHGILSSSRRIIEGILPHSPTRNRDTLLRAKTVPNG